MGRVTLTNKGLTHSIRTPFGTFSKRFGDGSEGPSSSGCGCLSLVLGSAFVLILVCAISGLISSASKRAANETAKAPPAQPPVAPQSTPTVVPPEPTPQAVSEPAVEVIASEPAKEEQRFKSRTWTDSTGKFSVVATLLSVEGEKRQPSEGRLEARFTAHSEAVERRSALCSLRNQSTREPERRAPHR